MKKFLVLLLCMIFSLGIFAGCNNNGENSGENGGDGGNGGNGGNDSITVGFIALHDDKSTYDKNFLDAIKAACEKKGIDEDHLIIKTNIPEDAACYEAAADLVDQGCNVIFADSFGHESYILQAAKEFPNVRFAHATGTTAHTELQGNFYNAFASVYQARYLAGVAAGMKLAEMYGNGDGEAVSTANAKIGYVGAFPYAEVVSGYTSFFLGVRSIVPAATMEVRYTNSWYDADAEENTARALIENGCKLISQHADSMGAPLACKDEGIPNVTYNVATTDSNVQGGGSEYNATYIAGSKVNWEPYFEYLLTCAINGVTAVGFDYCGDLANGSAMTLELGSAAAAGTAEKLAEVKAELIAGTRQVFDCSTFTVDGKALTSYLADVDTDANNTPDTQVIITENGITYFAESVYRSAPYFDVRIDGITEIKE